MEKTKIKAIGGNKKDRNEMARQIIKKEDLQRRRNFLNLMQMIKHKEEALKFNSEQIKSFEIQLNGIITQKRPDGTTYSREEMQQIILSTKQAYENLSKDILFIKEDLMNLMVGRDISLFQQTVKEHYAEIEEFYKKNFEGG